MFGSRVQGWSLRCTVLVDFLDFYDYDVWVYKDVISLHHLVCHSHMDRNTYVAGVFFLVVLVQPHP